MPPRVTVVTINWNGLRDTLACLESLRADIYPNKEVVVVDNGSSDDSVAVIRSKYPEVTVLEAGRNLGFTGGNNLGLRHAIASGAKYVYWLNNDTTSEPDAIAHLAEVAEHDGRYAMLTPVIQYYDYPAEAWFAGSRIDLSRGLAEHENSSPPATTDAVRRIPWASGCAMFGRCDVLARLGGFDNRYFLNWEDVDLCLRIVAMGAWVGLVPKAKIYHKVGKTFATCSHVGRYYHVRNNLMLMRHHLRPWNRAAATRLACSRVRESLRFLRQGRMTTSNSLWITLYAIWHYLSGRDGEVNVPRSLANVLGGL